MAEALDFVNSKEVFHRDVKPENIMIADSGRAVLIDFGIVHLPWAPALTETDARIGTPGMIPPEQLPNLRKRANSRRAEELAIMGARCDQWSLAASVYSLLTGEEPGKSASAEFQLEGAPNGSEASIVAVERAVAAGRIPPASELRPEIPQEVSNVLAKALAVNETARYGDCGEFVAALATATSRPPQLLGCTTAVPIRWPPPAEEMSVSEVASPARKRRGLRVLAGIAAATGLVAGGMLIGPALLENTPGAATSRLEEGTSLEGLVPGGEDAGSSVRITDAEVREVAVTIETTLRGKLRKGVRIEVDGEERLSPVSVMRPPGQSVTVRITDRDFRAESRTIVARTADYTETVALRRRSSRRTAPERSGKPDAGEKILRPRVEGTP